MNQPPAAGAMFPDTSVWLSDVPHFPRQSPVNAPSRDQPLGHPSPQGQAIAPTQDISSSQIIGGLRASTIVTSTSRTSTSRTSTSRTSNTRASARGVPKARTCTVCKKTFRDVWTLRDHMPTHSLEQPFECNDCGRCFKRRKDLKTHTKKSCPSNSQASATPSSYPTQNTQESEVRELQYIIETPELYKQGIQNGSKADLESELDERHKPWLFPTYEQPDDPPQPIIHELDGVPQGSDVSPDVTKVLFSPEFLRTYNELSHSAGVGGNSTVVRDNSTEAGDNSTVVGDNTDAPRDASWDEVLRNACPELFEELFR